MAPSKAASNLEKQQFAAEQAEKRRILKPRITSLVSALGGYEDVLVTNPESGKERLERQYRLGDECLGCLKDLKKFWRLDDDDEDRTVSRLLYECKVLENDLVPILLAAQNQGAKGTRLALLCSDLIAAFTWPIDVAVELKESQDLDDDASQRIIARVDYSGLIAAQLSYKREVLRSGVLSCMFRLIVPALEKPRRQRTEKDINIISLILHVIRNLAALRDPVPIGSAAGASSAATISLQSELVLQLEKLQIWDFLILVSHKSNSEEFRPWNVLALDIFHLMFRGIDVPDLVAAVPLSEGSRAIKAGGLTFLGGNNKLERLLTEEADQKRREARKSNSRHSRFGTTLSVQTGGKTYHLHQQSAITTPVEESLDKRKKQSKGGARGANTTVIVDELGGKEVELSQAALRALRAVGISFIESAFNPFFASILSDIRMERQKVREADSVRFLYLLRFFLSFFLHLRQAYPAPSKAPGVAAGPSSDAPKEGGETEQSRDAIGGQIERFGFDLIAEMTEPGALGWVTIRMKNAHEEKPVLAKELQASVECLIQMLLVIGELTKSGTEENVEVAVGLQNRLYYEADTLDTVLDLLGKYSPSQLSLKYLDSIIYLAFVLLRMLEKYSKSKEYMYVRKRKKGGKKKSRGKGGEDENDEAGLGELDEEQEVEDAEQKYAERKFTFRDFERKFADEGVLRTLIMHLRGYKDFRDPEQMRRVVKLMHRQAINASADIIFFKASVLDLLYKIAESRRTLPRNSAYDDLQNLIDYIVKRFFKAAKSNPFMLVEVFFPKRKSQWERVLRGNQSDDELPTRTKARKTPAEIEVKPGLTWSQQAGVAIGLLVDNNKSYMLDSVKDALRKSLATRQAIVLMTDGMSTEGQLVPASETPEEAKARITKSTRGPSDEARAKFKDYTVDVNDEDTRTGLTRDAQLQLLIRLIGWEKEEDPNNPGILLWKIPRLRLPDELEVDIKTIDYYLLNPLDEDGKSAFDWVRRKRKPRTRKTREVENDSVLGTSDDEGQSKRHQKTKKRQEETRAYKSAQFIADSDDDDDAVRDAEFFAREKALPALMAAKAGNAGATGPASVPRPKPKTYAKPTKEKHNAQRQEGKTVFEADMTDEEVDELASSHDETELERLPSQLERHSSSPEPDADMKDAPGDRRRSTSPPSSVQLRMGRKRSLSTTPEVLGAPKQTKTRRLIMDSDEED